MTSSDERAQRAAQLRAKATFEADWSVQMRTEAAATSGLQAEARLDSAQESELFAFALRLAASVLDPSDATAWLMGMPMLEGETRIAEGRAALNALVDSVKAGKDG